MFSEINGTAKAARKLSMGLARLGHDVHVYAPNKPVNWTDELNTHHLYFHEMSGLKPPYEQDFRLNFPFLDILSMGLHKETITNHDIVHAQTPEGLAFYGWAMAKFAKIPKVITAHSPLIFYTEDVFGPVSAMYINRIFWIYEPMLYNRFDLRAVPTPSKKRFIMNQGFKNPIFSISNGIEDFYFQDAHPEKVRDKYNLHNKKILLYASRLAPEKNQDKIVDAFKFIHDRVPESHLIIVGTGPFESTIRQRIKINHLDDAVTMTGFVTNEDLLDYYAAADITTLWSVVEAPGLVLLEAMAQGTPSIGINAMGIKDVIVDGKTGYLCNTIEQFIKMVVKVFQDDELHEQLSQNCLHYIEAHRMENIARTWVKIYELMIDSYPMIISKANVEKQARVYEDFARANEFVEY